MATAILSLLGAARRLAFRGSGPAAWAAPLVDDPVAFLLDSTSDAVVIWTAGGRLLYANDAAKALDLGEPPAPGLSLMTVGGRELERRCLSFALFGATYIIEVIRPATRATDRF